MSERLPEWLAWPRERRKWVGSEFVDRFINLPEHWHVEPDYSQIDFAARMVVAEGWGWPEVVTLAAYIKKVWCGDPLDDWRLRT